MIHFCLESDYAWMPDMIKKLLENMRKYFKYFVLLVFS